MILGRILCFSEDIYDCLVLSVGSKMYSDPDVGKFFCFFFVHYDCIIPLPSLSSIVSLNMTLHPQQSCLALGQPRKLPDMAENLLTGM